MSLTTVDQGLLGTYAQYTGFKNRLINGQMQIDQRNAGASITPAAGGFYDVDRWAIYSSVSSKLTAQQNAGSVTPPAGFKNYLGVTTASAYSPGASDFFVIYQPIEGFNVADLGWGAVGASSVTLSFWVRSSLTGTQSGSITSYSYNNIAYVFTFTVNSANTWEYKTITIPGATTGSWNTNNNGSLQVNFNLGSGSSVSGTPNTWLSGQNYWGATGAQSIVANAGATFYITGVQLEKGSTATSFDYRPYGTELALCMRYFQKGVDLSIGGYGRSSVSCYEFRVLNVPMRAAATVTFTGGAGTWTGANAWTGGSNGIGAGPLGIGYSFITDANGSATASVTAISAEL